MVSTHSSTSRTWSDGLSLVSNSAHMRCKHFCTIFFFDFSGVRPNLFLITGIRVIICGMAFYHPNCLICLRAFPYDRFKINTIIQIELNSIQPIEVVSVIRVICWNKQDDHMETRHACVTMCIILFAIHCTIHPSIQSWPLFFNHHPASKCKPSNLIECNLTNHTQPSANEHNQKLLLKRFFFWWGLECVRISSIWFEMLLRTDLRSNDFISQRNYQLERAIHTKSP